jgi:hypothetical protein
MVLCVSAAVFHAAACALRDLGRIAHTLQPERPLRRIPLQSMQGSTRPHGSIRLPETL